MALSERQYTAVNALGFQLAWPVCVLGGDAVAVATTLTLLLIHLSVIRRWQTELLFLSSAGLLGFLFDLALVRGGLLQIESAVQPIWMWCLWFIFAATLGYSLQWFRRHLGAGALFAGIFAPLSYSVGARLTDVDLMTPDWLTLLVIGAAWSLIFPALFLLRDALGKLSGEPLIENSSLPKVSAAKAWFRQYEER
ncbi:MAG: DUF2878 domain-containing protein [Pseudomonadota bacterium]